MLNDTKHGKSTPPIGLTWENFQLNTSDKNPISTIKILKYIIFGDIRQKYSIYPTF